MSVEIWNRNDEEGDGWTVSGGRKNKKGEGADQEPDKDEPDIRRDIGRLPDLGIIPAIPSDRDRSSEDEDAGIRQSIIDKDKLEIN